MNIHEFRQLPHRFRWGGVGGDDCTTFCASWVERQTGIDPAADLRGTYRDSEGAHRILREAGGLVPFMASHLDPLCFRRVDLPSDGDIGVIATPAGLGEGKEVGAIRFGPLWLVLGPGGVVGKKAQMIAAWRLIK